MGCSGCRGLREGPGGAQADGDPQWLQWAYQLQDTMDSLFWDERGGAPASQLQHGQLWCRVCLELLYRSPHLMQSHKHSTVVSRSTWAAASTAEGTAVCVCNSLHNASAAGGYFSTTGDDASILLRMKEVCHRRSFCDSACRRCARQLPCWLSLFSVFSSSIDTSCVMARCWFLEVSVTSHLTMNPRAFQISP